MQGTVLAEWEHDAAQNSAATIIPDGCRDLLFRALPGDRPQWQITALDSSAYRVDIKAGEYMKGFRLRPGVQVDVAGLLACVDPLDGQGRIVERINDFTVLPALIDDALGAIAQSGKVARAAAMLGVNARQLQRICRATGRTPGAWLSLARARKAARLIGKGDLCDVALQAGYADQAHMTREFTRWFGMPPLKLRSRPEIAMQLTAKGFA